MVSIEEISGVLSRERIHEDVFICDAKKIDSICFSIKNQLGYIWLKNISAFENENGVELKYLFYFLENNYKFTLSILLPKSSAAKSIAHIWLNASYMEQEVYELHKIEFTRSYSNLLFEKKIDFAEFKPILINPLTSATLRFSTSWKKNLVKKSRILTGMFHIGLEKILQDEEAFQTFYEVENHFDHRGALWSLAHMRSIELYNQIEIPDRAKALRMVIMELIRVLDHLVFLRDLHLELKHIGGVTSYNAHIKRISSLNISLAGNPHLKGINKIGGLIKGVDQGWVSRAMDELEELSSVLRLELNNTKENLKINETLDFPLLDKTLAYGRCLSGPIARCTGLNLDLRKSEPEYFYRDVDFEVPIGTSGSAFDLYSVKYEEIFQSIKIIVQVLDNLPTGFISVQKENDLRLQGGIQNKLSSESYKQEFWNFKNVPDCKGSYFFEGPNGHLGIDSVIESSKLRHIKFFSNDFLLKNVFSEVSRNKEYNELALSWVSLGIDMKAVEK